LSSSFSKLRVFTFFIGWPPEKPEQSTDMSIFRDAMYCARDEAQWPSSVPSDDCLSAHGDFPHCFTPAVNKSDASFGRGPRWAFHLSCTIIFAVLSLMVTCPPAFPAEPPFVIGHSFADQHGGDVEEFAALYAAIRAEGQKVVIDGPCISACTIVASLPRDQVCITPRALFGVHLAVDDEGMPDPAYTAWAVKTYYPSALQDWIARHGGLTDVPKWIEYRDLLAIFRPCGPDDGAPTADDAWRGGQ
jgi:hypothetical protein